MSFRVWNYFILVCKSTLVSTTGILSQIFTQIFNYQNHCFDEVVSKWRFLNDEAFGLQHQIWDYLIWNLITIFCLDIVCELSICNSILERHLWPLCKKVIRFFSTYGNCSLTQNFSQNVLRFGANSEQRKCRWCLRSSGGTIGPSLTKGQSIDYFAWYWEHMGHLLEQQVCTRRPST